MKNVILITLFATLLLTSCRLDKNSALDHKGNVVTTQFTKEITLPENLCGLITIDMIMAHFEVQKNELDLEDDFSQCGYSWKKANFEELREQQINTVFSITQNGSEISSEEDDKFNTTMSDVIISESPYNTIQVGNFEKHDNLQEAVNRFTMLHRVPTKEEMNRLYNEMKKQIAKEHLNNEAIDTDRVLALGVPKNMKFEKIDGIGDQAFYDYLDKSLDVRYGKISFKVYIDSEKDIDTNIKIAKELAEAVWEKL